MKVQISNLKAGLVCRGTEPLDARSVSTDPEGRVAVIELTPNELFVAGRVLRREEELLVVDYVDDYLYPDSDLPMLMEFSVAWDCLQFGFCKLRLWALELPGERGGVFEHTVKRFWFDRALYEKCKGDAPL